MVGGFDSPLTTGIDGSFVHPREFYAEMTRAVGPYAITDFQASRDTIQLDHSAFADFASVLSHATQVGSDIVIAQDAHDELRHPGRFGAGRIGGRDNHLRHLGDQRFLRRADLHTGLVLEHFAPHRGGELKGEGSAQQQGKTLQGLTAVDRVVHEISE